MSQCLVVVLDYHQFLAGAKTRGGDGFADTLETMKSFVGKTTLTFASRGSTAIGAVATNARLTKEEAGIIAQMAHDGLARAVRPAHTMFDGDTLFSLATGQKRANVNVIGAYAAEVVADAVVRSVEPTVQSNG